MELLKEIFHVKGMQTEGLTIFREAVRGIIFHNKKLLMVHSSKRGDYKFPGGGIKVGETQHEALAREIREECGAQVIQVGQTFGKVVEYDRPVEPNFAVFKMTSYYFFCQVEYMLHEQQLDSYELELGFLPVWIEIEDALRKNEIIANTTPYNSNNHTASQIRWLSREIFVLKEIQKRCFTT